MSIGKLQHEKLLAAIQTARQETIEQRRLYVAVGEKLVTAEAELKKARAEADGRARACDELKRRNAELSNAVFVRETAIVQTALRLAAYGDPGLTLSVTS